VKPFALAALLLIACGGNEATKQVAPRAATTPSAAPSGSTATGQASAPVPSVPLELALSVERTQDGLGLHVINRGSSAVSLAADVALEKKSASSFTPVSGQALKLRFDCKSQGCVSLAPGGELIAPAWLGRPDGERCDSLLQPSEAGSYRLVVRSCTGKERAELAFEAAALALSSAPDGKSEGAPK
jgi:hypothetical protein